MKKILLISYYFNPCQAIGSKRWSEFFKLFNQDEAFEITVLTANWVGEKEYGDNVIYIGEAITFKPFQSINKEFTSFDILKHPSLYFRSLERGMFSDQWYKDTKKWIDNNREKEYDIVISSYTPMSTIRLGTYAKKVFDAKYIVDMRDMMSLQGQKIQLPLIHSIDNWLDKYWLREADEILSVGPTICKKASKFYNQKVHLIYNAFLEEEFEDKNTISSNTKLIFSYLGTMGIKRNPRGLIHIVNEYCKKNPDIEIELRFASQDNPNEFVKDLAVEHIKLNWLGYLNKTEVSKLKEESDSFILLEDMDEKGKENVTGKVFEYLLEQKPVLAYCHPNSDVKKILDESGIGEIVTTEQGFELFLKQIRDNEFEILKENILLFSREKQYELVKELL